MGPSNSKLIVLSPPSQKTGSLIPENTDGPQIRVGCEVLHQKWGLNIIFLLNEGGGFFSGETKWPKVEKKKTKRFWLTFKCPPKTLVLSPCIYPKMAACTHTHTHTHTHTPLLYWLPATFPVLFGTEGPKTTKKPWGNRQCKKKLCKCVHAYVYPQT